MKKKITIKDIAEIAEVDHSTVSRALNNSPRVSAETRKRIQEIARRMHFEFNAIGRSLSRGKSGNIAVIHSEDGDVFGTSQYFNLLFRSLRKDLERRKMDALILEAYNPETGESNIARLIRQNKVDGFLLVHAEIRREDYLMILESGKPMIQLHARPKYFSTEHLDYYFTDNVEGGRIATEHLISKGCRSIINLTGCREPSGEFAMRLEGYKLALEQAGISFDPNLIFFNDCSYQSGYQTVYANQELFRESDGVFAQADIVAFGCLTALKELGIQPPRDILITGFDDTPLCLLPVPGITSVHQPVEELTKLACDRISHLLKYNTEKHAPAAGYQHDQQELKPWLVTRGSTQYIKGSTGLPEDKIV